MIRAIPRTRSCQPTFGAVGAFAFLAAGIRKRAAVRRQPAGLPSNVARQMTGVTGATIGAAEIWEMRGGRSGFPGSGRLGWRKSLWPDSCAHRNRWALNGDVLVVGPGQLPDADRLLIVAPSVTALPSDVQVSGRQMMTPGTFDQTGPSQRLPEESTGGWGRRRSEDHVSPAMWPE